MIFKKLAIDDFNSTICIENQLRSFKGGAQVTECDSSCADFINDCGRTTYCDGTYNDNDNALSSFPGTNNQYRVQ